MPEFSPDYLERVYAGVLGKIIGVYLGRPFEGWHYDKIVEKLGDIEYYVHEKLGQPLIVADDDISGTFTFLRALEDHDYPKSITARQVGETWLNYLIEERTVLWWGGLGCSTEHTAYLRLKHGIPAPESGSIARNGQVVAEQIGSQIFIDGWGMINPGDPEKAAWYAALAASVSHDGEAIYGAQVVAAMEAAAFVEPDISKLIDIAVSLIPADSVIARMIGDIRKWHSGEPDWRVTRKRIEESYGYDKYGGGCHMVPNHALIILALLYGGGDFSRSLSIVNTAGWDTDCNSANVGCLLGIRNGLDGLHTGPDWRGPVADRILLPTADAGRCITDAATEAVAIANAALTLAEKPLIRFKDGARFHFELPGSVQGFAVESVDCKASLANVVGGSAAGARSLRIDFAHLGPDGLVFAATPTFSSPAQLSMTGYAVMASPTVFHGQTLRARVSAAAANAERVVVGLCLRHYGAGDELVTLSGSTATLAPGAGALLEWRIPATCGHPIASVGVNITSGTRTTGAIHLDYLTWDGVPNTTFSMPADGGTVWSKAWVNGVDRLDAPVWGGGMFGTVQNEGTGLVIGGARQWRDYSMSTQMSIHMAAEAGIAARVQGMKRYYAFVLCAGGKARLIKASDGMTVLAETDLDWRLDQKYDLGLRVEGSKICALLDGKVTFEYVDDDKPLTEGAIGIVCKEGRAVVDWIALKPML